MNDKINMFITEARDGVMVRIRLDRINMYYTAKITPLDGGDIFCIHFIFFGDNTTHKIQYSDEEDRDRVLAGLDSYFQQINEAGLAV